MNWRRGLLRLWAVLAILWVCAVAGWLYANWPPLKMVLASPTSKEIAEIAACKAKLPPPLTGHELDSGQIACELASTHSTAVLDYSTIATYAVTAAGVPLLILLLGAATRWVLVGFKR